MRRGEMRRGRGRGEKKRGERRKEEETCRRGEVEKKRGEERRRLKEMLTWGDCGSAPAASSRVLYVPFSASAAYRQ